MNKLAVGDKVKLITPSRETGLLKWLGYDQVHTVGEVHEGNLHTPEQMISLVGGSGCMMYSWRFEKIPTNKYEVLVKYRNTGDEGILHKHTRVIVEAVDENEARLSAIDAAFVKHPGGEHFTPVEAKELMDEVLP